MTYGEAIASFLRWIGSIGIFLVGLFAAALVVKYFSSAFKGKATYTKGDAKIFFALSTLIVIPVVLWDFVVYLMEDPTFDPRLRYYPNIDPRMPFILDLLFAVVGILGGLWIFLYDLGSLEKTKKGKGKKKEVEEEEEEEKEEEEERPSPRSGETARPQPSLASQTRPQSSPIP